jgi:adenosylhomocysteinase
VDEIKALEAVMDGYEVLPMAEAAARGNWFITTTGVKDVITMAHIQGMPDGAILANAGHFYDEIDLDTLAAEATERTEVRDNLTGYRLGNGRWINVIADGKIVNISAADGHPAEIMDTSFAVQALSAEYLVTHAGDTARAGTATSPALPSDVIRVPREIDYQVARLRLAAFGVSHDHLTPAQEQYLRDFVK